MIVLDDEEDGWTSFHHLCHPDPRWLFLGEKMGDGNTEGGDVDSLTHGYVSQLYAFHGPDPGWTDPDDTRLAEAVHARIGDRLQRFGVAGSFTFPVYPPAETLVHDETNTTTNTTTNATTETATEGPHVAVDGVDLLTPVAKKAKIKLPAEAAVGARPIRRRWLVVLRGTEVAPLDRKDAGRLMLVVAQVAEGMGLAVQRSVLQVSRSLPPSTVKEAIEADLRTYQMPIAKGG